MKIKVRSVGEAKKFTSEVPWVAISIASYQGDIATLNKENRNDLLQLVFKDVDLAGRQGGMEPHHAQQILSFFKKWHDKVDVVLIHCEAGLSRSPAIAAALSKIWTGDDTEWFGGQYTPNMLVYRLLINEALNDPELQNKLLNS